MENKLNIYAKLAQARVKLQEAKLKKTGHNSFAKYDYYQLDDFIPEINKINKELGLITLFGLSNEKATLTLFDIDNNNSIEFSIPTAEVEIKGAMTIQNLGGEITYLKRYLYLNCYEIVEPDTIEAIQENAREMATPKPYKPKGEKASSKPKQTQLDLPNEPSKEVEKPKVELHVIRQDQLEFLQKNLDVNNIKPWLMKTFGVDDLSLLSETEADTIIQMYNSKHN